MLRKPSGGKRNDSLRGCLDLEDEAVSLIVTYNCAANRDTHTPSDIANA